MKKFYSVISLSFLIIILLAVPAAGASEWVEFHKGTMGNVTLYKKVITKEGLVRYVVKEVFSDQGREEFIRERTKRGLSTKGYETLSNSQSLSEIDCQKKQIMNISVFYFDTQGKKLDSYSVDTPRWVKIPNDLFFNALLKEICK